ncbi:MAG: diacylglycerol kinase family protein [Myxococcales bacterium]|jgi:YegS/Rv2252/BmrU family lipid kinase
MIDPRRTTIIANPAAAGGRVGARWSDIEKRLRAHLGECAFRVSRRRGDISALVRSAIDSGADTILSLGGDGTHGEVLGGIMAASGGRVRLGILPAGTGGDFARMLVTGPAASLDDAAGALCVSPSAAIDVGSIEYTDDGGQPASRYFLNLASVGISGLVDRLVNASSKRLGGHLSFLFGTARALRTYRPVEARIVVDGHSVGDYVISTVTVCNGRYAGGGMIFAPDARLADGLLDVILIRHGPLLRSLVDSRKLYYGTHVRSSRVSCWRGREVEVVPVGAELALVDIDGDSPGRAPARFRVHPGAVDLIGARLDML